MTTFMDLPIEGEINRMAAPVPQRPVEELYTLLRAVLAAGVVSAVRWHQYTPYFNDGEPCVFSVHGASFSYVAFDPENPIEDDDSDYGDGFVSSWDEGYKKILGEVKYEWDENRQRTETVIEGTHPMLGKLARDLKKALDSGAHYVALADAFGDHARVTVTSTKIYVDEYDHD